MKNLSPEYGLTFDDILLIPKHSEVASRDIPDTSTYVGHLNLSVPILSAPMDTVSGLQLCQKVGKAGGLGVIARDPRKQYSLDDIDLVKRSAEDIAESPMAMAIGCKWDKEFVFGGFLKEALHYINVLVLDVAHADSKHVHSFLNKLVTYVRSWSNEYGKERSIIAGSIATSSAAERMIKLGVDGLRVGIGNGCFIAGTLVLTKGGLKPIEDIQVDEEVFTHRNRFRKVVSTMSRKETERIFTINDDISCTDNHEFYVLPKKYRDAVNDDNVHDYAFWIRADELSDQYLLLKKKDN